MYVVENVPGMKKFKVVMEAMTKLPDYYVHVFCPVDAANWLLQKRQRLILVGTRKPFAISYPKAVAKKPRIKDILEPAPKVDLPEYVIKRMNGGYRDLPIIVDLRSATVVVETQCIASLQQPLGVRPFTVREYARLQGFPGDFCF